ncbi:hypothetical protein HG535_0B00780 [Zygotorulaspora mrakii]|uniref:Heat shock transcription factor n=1 Tax=Zygotorulaspora mrakii TaxID=42260 RepID=A0A7H9AX96_ZYGMR|nr:uncharacterized protein HG535_0B00780 [Zygotorulaspora mrakii]QLG71040.1 hypothetical protein HG535_0B00780 [Zygotorulaspora mrakii]
MDKLPNFNDEDIEKILHPNNLFGDELRPLEKDTSSGVIEDIVNPSLDAESLSREDTGSSSNQPGTHLIQRMAPMGIYQGSPHMNNNNQLLPFRNAVQPAQPATPQQQQSTRHSKTRPAFVNKVWSMLNDESNANLIHWSDDGKSFIVVNREEFVHEILPKYFKHSNFASFVRQLNMYGWHKVQDVRSGSIQTSTDDKGQFENEFFIRGREDLLEKIVRQKSSATNAKVNNANGGPYNGSDLNVMGELNLGDSSNINALLGELEQIKYNQMAISKDLLRINKDNEMLWKENMMARERHRTQQQALEKILRFLASLVPHMDQKMITEGILNNSNNNVPINSHNGNINGNDSSNDLHIVNNFDEDLTNLTANTPLDSSQPYGSNAYSLNEPMLMDQRGKSRYLLKNRTNSTTSSSTSRMRNYSSDGRISEIPFDQDEETNSESNLDKSNYAVGLRDQNARYNPNFFNHLQSNIDEQDERIKHLEDMVHVLSPSDPNLNKNQQMNSNAHLNPNTNFDLQDYCFSNVNSPTLDANRHTKLNTSTGLSPLIQTDNEDLISLGNLPNTLISDVSGATQQSVPHEKRSAEEMSEASKDAMIEEINTPSSKRSRS